MYTSTQRNSHSCPRINVRIVRCLIVFTVLYSLDFLRITCSDKQELQNCRIQIGEKGRQRRCCWLGDVRAVRCKDDLKKRFRKNIHLGRVVV